jgi:hypothetical protein
MIRNLGLLMCMLPLFVMAGSGSMYSYRISDNSWISLSGTTNINSFTCTSAGEIPRGFIMADILPGSNAIYFSDANMDVPVTSFDCKNRMMNNDLHESLGGQANPTIKINLLEARMMHNAQNESNGKLYTQVEITINGKTKITDVTVGYNQINPYSFLISGSKDMLMSEFGIDPPSPMLGMVRVNNKVSINFHLFIETSLITQSN